MQIQGLYYKNVEKCIFPPQRDYMKEISQLLVHTLEEMRTKERRAEGEERTKEERSTDKNETENSAHRLGG